MILSIVIIAFLGISWIFTAIIIAFQKENRKRNFGWIAYLASFLLVIGGAGFFGSGMSAIGGLNWLPNSFEWPIGFATNALELENGNIIIPHTPTNRLQIYDSKLHFIRGWHVNASGGVFKARIIENGNIEVVTARGNLRLVYHQDGSLVSTEKYLSSYDSFPDEKGRELRIPTFPLLIIFSNPFIAWFLAALGGFLLFIRDKIIKSDKFNKNR